jgi:hypothetical protein
VAPLYGAIIDPAAFAAKIPLPKAIHAAQTAVNTWYQDHAMAA